jgi:carboxymethylenebutenolidase
MVDEFVEVAKRANVNLMVHRYEANHGFANPSNPIYDKEATEDAHKKSLAFIRERMK